MNKNRLISGLGFINFLISMILFYVGMKSFESSRTWIFLMFTSLVALAISFVFIGSLRCKHCGKKLNIEPFPSYNPLPKFFLWTGAEARCGHCHEKV